MPTTVKISQLPSASYGDIIPSSSVLPIIDGNTTKQITVENLFIAAGTAISGNLVPVPNVGETTSSFSLGSELSAWKDLYVSDGTIFLQKGDGTRSTFNKQDVDDLKAGKSLNKGASQLTNELDDTTYVRMGQAGKAWHYASGKPLIKLQTSSFGLGSTNVPMTLEGSSLVITGSTEISGSCTVSGSFTVTDLLTVLANYGQTGSFSVSGSTTLDGDVNLDGQVTVTDLLTVLAGFGASGSCDVSGSLEISGSNVGGSPPALVITGSTAMTGSCTVNGPFTVTDLLTVLANYGQTGSFSVSGSTTLDGDVNLDGQVTVTDLLTVLAGFGASGSCDVSGSLEISGSNVGGSPPALVITGSTAMTGSCTVNGPFTVTDLLTVLANYGQTGSFSVSGSTTLDGDVNCDGVVNVQDLLTVLGGMDVSGSSTITGSVEISGSIYCTGTVVETFPNSIVISGSRSLTLGTHAFRQVRIASGTFMDSVNDIDNFMQSHSAYYGGSGPSNTLTLNLPSVDCGHAYNIINTFWPGQNGNYMGHNGFGTQPTIVIKPSGSNKFVFGPGGVNMNAGDKLIYHSSSYHTEAAYGTGVNITSVLSGSTYVWVATQINGSWISGSSPLD
jgi:hypothetical protein